MSTERVSPAPIMEYELQIRGELTRRWVSWFGNMKNVSRKKMGPEIIYTATVSVVDQGELLGLLQKLHHLGFCLLSLQLNMQSAREAA